MMVHIESIFVLSHYSLHLWHLTDHVMRDSDVTIPQADAWAISGLVSDTPKCVVSVVTGPDAELGAFPSPRVGLTQG